MVNFRELTIQQVPQLHQMPGLHVISLLHETNMKAMTEYVKSQRNQR